MTIHHELISRLQNSLQLWKSVYWRDNEKVGKLNQGAEEVADLNERSISMHAGREKLKSLPSQSMHGTTSTPS